jgi:hypothetical protein
MVVIVGIRVEVPQSSFTSLAASFSTVEDEIRECTRDATRKVADLLFDVIHTNISIDDHSLQDLRDLGHPYSRKNQSSGRVLGMKPFQVHTQRGVIRGTNSGPMHLVDALGIDSDFGGDVMTFDVGIDENDAQHVKYVVLGTKFMVARDFFAGSLIEAVDDMFDLFQKETGFKRLFTMSVS